MIPKDVTVTFTSDDDKMGIEDLNKEILDVHTTGFEKLSD